MRFLLAFLLCATPAMAADKMEVSPALVQDTVTALNKAMVAQCGDMDRINREWLDLLRQSQPKSAPPMQLPGQEATPK